MSAFFPPGSGEGGFGLERFRLDRFRFRQSFFFWAGLALALLLTVSGVRLVLQMEQRYRVHIGVETETMRNLDRIRYRAERLFTSLLASSAFERGGAGAEEGGPEAELRGLDELLRRTMRDGAGLGLEGMEELGAAGAGYAEQVRDVLDRTATRAGQAVPPALLEARDRLFESLGRADGTLMERHAADLAAQQSKADRSLAYGGLMVALLLAMCGGVVAGYRRWLRRLDENRVELAAATARAEEANLAKSLFLASVSHELRTPLNAVMGFSQMLRDEYYGPLNAKQAEYVEDIVDASYRLNALISEVLDFSRVETGRAELVLSPVRPADMVERVLSLVLGRALQAGVCLESETQELPTVPLDQNKVRQALLCMLDGTIRRSQAGDRVMLRARRATEREALRGGLAGGDWLLFIVDDEGGGMTEQECRDIFTPFHRPDGEAESGWKGAGLGLALVRKYAELHGGEAWSESEGPGRGAAIIMALPMEAGNTPGPDGRTE